MSVDPAIDRAARLLRDLSTHKTDSPMLAEPMERLTARLIDLAVWFIVDIVVLATSFSLFAERHPGREIPGVTESSISLTVAWGSLVTMLALFWCYEVPATAWTGGHFSKRRFGLMVVRGDGRPPGLSRATARWLALWLPAWAALIFFGATFGSALGFLGLGLEALAAAIPAFAFLREDRRGLHDILAGTRVLTRR